jgi:hypothetical protein
MGNIIIVKNLECNEWRKLGIWFDAPWKGG